MALYDKTHRIIHKQHLIELLAFILSYRGVMKKIIFLSIFNEPNLHLHNGECSVILYIFYNLYN